MKKIFIPLVMVLAFVAACVVYVPRGEDTSPYPYDGQAPGYYGDRDVSFFYNTLSPYGTWVQMAAYGYVWVPRNMGYRWRPYMYGHWVWTDCGWAWIAEEEWGWIPFHYGRWGWDDDMGWYWVPDTIWGPAWVFWRTNDLYYGWAPLPPGLAFDMRFGFRSRQYEIPERFWIFVEGRDFLENRLSSRVIPFERNGSIIRETVFNDRIVVRNSRVINEGLDPNDVRQMTGRTVDRLVLRDAGQAGREQVRGGEVQIYRPSVRVDRNVKPREFIGSSDARSRLADVRVFEPAQKTAAVDPLETVRQRHADELKIVERTQTDEIHRLDQNYAEREKNAKATAERDKIRREHDTAAAELKNRHDQEKQALTDRHKKDEEIVRGRAVRKK